MRGHRTRWQAHLEAHRQAHRHGHRGRHAYAWHLAAHLTEGDHTRQWHQHLHRRLHHRFRHSLGARLTFIFLLLATAGGVGMALAAQQRLGWAWVLLGLGLLTLLAYGTIRHLLRPLRSLAYGAAVFGRGEFTHRIRVHHHDEIGDLAHRFNRMADDIQAMLDAKRELLLAISHELRSPLTRARLNAELIDEANPQQQAIVKDLGHMRDLIEDLLERERLDAGHSALRLQSCDVGTLLTTLVHNRFAHAQAEGRIRVELSNDLPASMQLDHIRMQVLMGNLLDNALRHHDAALGPIVLAASITPSSSDAPKLLRISVRDLGPGVPEDALGKLGQPFFRPDAARTRDSGGVGLGLNLCHLIAQAHGGTLSLRNAQPGFEARVDLPCPQDSSYLL